MGAHQERTSEGMEQRIRSEERNSLSRERCNSQASRRVQLELQETGDCRRSTISSDVGEHWVQESCQGGVVQYCSRANTPSKVQHHHQGGKEEQDLYNLMKRSMEKKLRENRQSYQDPSWKKEQEAGTISKEVYPITSPQLMGRQISTKNELLRVYRESIRRGELASLCMKTKKGRETLTLSVMVKSQVAQNPGCREEGFGCYVPPETFPDYLPMCSKAKPDHSYDEVQLAQSGADIVKHHHH